MPIFIIIALDIVITLRFSINCSTLICSPTVLFAFKREASSETYGPRIYLLSNLLSIYLFASLLSNLYHKNTKNIYLILLSLSKLTFTSGREGIDNPFVALVASSLFVCVGSWDLLRSLLLDWYLGSQKLREILTLLCCNTLSSSREKPTQAQEVAVLRKLKPNIPNHDNEGNMP